MDNFDQLSDCSDSSKNSEYYSSDISTVSNLDEYKDEFLELKQLVKSSKIDCEPIKSSITSNSIVTWYEKQIENLNKTLKQNEFYKRTIDNLEKRDILYSEKVEQLLTQNQQLKDNLLAANNQVRRLLNIYDKNKVDTKTALLEQKNLQLEKNIYELTNTNYLLSSELNQRNFQKSEVENESKELKSENNELKLELSARITSVDELKKKISEQHVQLQEVSENNVKLSHSFELISNELEFVKKSETWHKRELQQFQQEKRQFREKILENEKFMASQEETVEQLKLELNSLRCSCDEIRLATLREKEKLLKQFELANKNMTKNEKECSNVNCDVTSDVGSITNHYESIIDDLTSDVLKMKSNFEYQQKCLENTLKEKSDMLGKCTLLQNSLNDKEDAVDKLGSITRDLREKLSFSITRQKEQTSEMLGLKETCAKLKTELGLKDEDKEIFEQSVNTIKKQFKQFISKYTDLKNELHKRNREVSQLHYEKQELCIENDRRFFELNINLEKSALEIKNLNQRLTYLETTEKDIRFKNEQHVTTIANINTELVNLQKLYDNLRVQAADSPAFSGETDLCSLYSAKIEDVVKNICNLCKINYDDYRNSVTNTNLKRNEDKSDSIQLLLNTILTHIELVQAYKAEILIKRTDKLNVVRRDIVGRIFNVMERCKTLEIKNEENIRVLNTLCSAHDKNFHSGVEIQRLQTRLQVKTQEEKDKQKRYERNYRTLLRKVKEHMKGRKATEKHNTYLQELHNNVSSERNTLRLELDSKISEVNELQNRLDKASVFNEKLKSTVLKVEERLSVNKFCTNCAELRNLKKREVELEKSLKNYENCNSTNISELKLKEELLESLQNEKERLLTEISSKDFKYRESVTRMESVIQDNKALSSKIIDVENKLTHEKSIDEQIRKELKILKDEHFLTVNENNLLNNKLQLIEEKNSHLLTELKYLDSCLQNKCEEVIELQQRKENSGRRWLENETNMNNLIRSLSSQVHVFKVEIDTIKNEKFFLQRLCNDLKVALKTHVGHNKVLKNFLENTCKPREQNDIESIILSNFPSPVKYDDVQIDNLLKESRAPLEDKPFCDIQDGLNTLRMEILLLQKQITEKNVN